MGGATKSAVVSGGSDDEQRRRSSCNGADAEQTGPAIVDFLLRGDLARSEWTGSSEKWRASRRWFAAAPWVLW